MTETKTVLFVQRYPDGGSITSLLDLVRALDPVRFRPVVAFRTPNAFLDEFRAAGAAVEVLHRQPDAPAPVQPKALRAPSQRHETRWWHGVRRVVRRAVRQDLPAAVRLRRVARRHQVDLIHGNNDVGINRDAVLVSAVLGLPMVNHVRGLYDPTSPLDLWVDRRAARRVRRFFFISHAVARQYEPIGVPSERSEVIDNPFDLDRLRAEPSPEVAASVGLVDGDRAIVHLGRITPWKGQDILLRALPQILEQVPASRVVLVGAATDEQGRVFEAELRALAAELGVADRVEFAGARRDIAALLAVADVAVHSSTDAEPFGRVIVEAMAASRPVVAAAAGGVPEIVEDGVTGLLVTPGDPAALAGAVGRLLADPEAAGAMGARAAAAAAARFGLRAHAERIQAAYDDVLAGG